MVGFVQIYSCAYIIVAAFETCDPQTIAQLTARKQRGDKVTETWKVALTAALPALFINVVQTGYVLTIFPLFSAVDSDMWRVFVWALAFGCKAIGNKLLIKLLLNTGGARAVSDVGGEFVMYWYEITTALLCRLLLLSIPDAQVAVAMSLVNTTAETQIRTWFYMLYMTAGLKFDEATSDETKSKHWAFGMARVADASNDMVVEYVTAIIGVYLVYSFSDPHGPIVASSNEGDAHSNGTLLFILATQIGPELVVDFYCTLLEIKGGLMSQHEDYWADFFTTRGFVKSVLKINWGVCVVSWVLLMGGNNIAAK
ncbi:hypothetical protein TeGR_g2648 [Tetraparma gracilis]|uniref:Uncharacterized protein n=1 Tax=Tetraparma gracilis TaxID=2962635 RepID=A0ABQ6MPU8_9STRA|nr:hypothetical protein TeGR_g2648 [Tetraparma gracilis]